MYFEYDSLKSSINEKKHGISFEEAKELWNDEQLIEVPARSDGESRFFCIGKIGDKFSTAVITYRGDSKRIISVRRARKEEVNLYDNY